MAERRAPWRDRWKALLLRRPFSEWTSTHRGRLLPTAPVARAPGARPLPGRSRPLDATYVLDGRRYRLADPAAQVAVVTCSAWPDLDDELLDRETLTALRALAAHLAG